MFNYFRNGTVIFALLISLTACGGGGGGGNGNGETTAPTSTVVPSAPVRIMSSTPIVITFDQSMDTTSLSLSGSMMGDGGVWSSVNIEDDTLTVSPQTLWDTGDQTLTFDAQNTTGEAAGVQTLMYTVDNTAPTLSVLPASGSAIRNNVTIVLSFSESIDIDSLSASGSLWDESDQGVWSSNTNSNDTLTLTPTTRWIDGTQTITIDANDIAGNALVTQMYSYLVDATTTVASLTPMDGGTLMQTMPVVITFTKSMRPDTLSGSDLLWNESTQAWSSGDRNNDTLTLSPMTQWSLVTHPLTLDVTDVFGDSITVTASFSVGCAAGMDVCNGACINTSTDINNCGACNTACATPANTNGVACTAGSCTIQTCTTGFGNCNGRFADGCESNLATDVNNCGSCNAAPCSDGVSCTRDSCEAGRCRSSADNDLCRDTVVIGACIYADTCAEVGSRTNIYTPASCNAVTGCYPTGTPYSETVVCGRSTDGNSCLQGAGQGICIGGVCEGFL